MAGFDEAPQWTGPFFYAWADVFHKQVARPSESPTSKHTENQKIEMLISQQRRYNKFQKLEYKLSYVFRASYYGPNAIALVVI
jgi:hypothetical protein